MTNVDGQAKGKEPVERVVDLFVHMPIGFAVMAWKRVPEFVGSVPGLVGEALSKGCAQAAQVEERLSEEVRKARMIGQVAVTFGGRQLRREVDARLRDARQAAEGVASFLPGVGAQEASNGSAAPVAASDANVSARPTPSAPASAPAPPAKTTRPSTKPAGARKTTASKASGATKTSGAATVSGAPKTSGAATVSGAPSATDPSASAAALPIPEYDGLSASQVVSRLAGLAPDELRAVRDYEAASRGRRTVLQAIDRLLG